MDSDRKITVVERLQFFSRIMGEFVEIQGLLEEDTIAILNVQEFVGLTYDQYKECIVTCWPGLEYLFADIAKTKKRKLVDELWPKLLDLNPALSPEQIEKHEVNDFISEEEAEAIEENARNAKTPKRADDKLRVPKVSEVRILMKELRAHLHDNLIGQREAVDVVVEGIGKRMLAKERGSRPVCALFFAGPTGVGKTELARQIAILMGGAAERLVQINCGEYAESHTAQRILGAPPGYIGHERGGLLESKIKQDGNLQVLLFDEFEKAHPRMQSLLLSALEDGYMDLGNNKKVYFTECVIIFTSNIGSDLLKKGALGFGATHGEADWYKSVENYLPSEFFNRIDRLVIFKQLTEEEYASIAELQLSRLRERMDHLTSVTWEASVITYVARAKGREKYGARRVRHKVESIESKLCDSMLRSEEEYTSIKLSITANELWAQADNGSEWRVDA